MVPTKERAQNSGIYRITNRVDGRVYIGRTICFEDRRRQHFYDLRSRRHANKHLQDAFDQDGEDAFEFTQILSCDPCVCDEVEKALIESYGSTDETVGFNCGSTPRQTFVAVVVRFSPAVHAEIRKRCREPGANVTAFVRAAVMEKLKRK